MALAVPEGGLCLSSFNKQACSPEGAKKSLHNRFVCAAQQAGLCGPGGHWPLEPEGGDMALMNTMVIPPLYVKVFHLFSYACNFFSCLWSFFCYFINFFISYAYYIFRLFFCYLFSCLCSFVYSFAESHYLLS